MCVHHQYSMLLEWRFADCLRTAIKHPNNLRLKYSHQFTLRTLGHLFILQIIYQVMNVSTVTVVKPARVIVKEEGRMLIRESQIGSNFLKRGTL